MGRRALNKKIQILIRVTPEENAILDAMAKKRRRNNKIEYIREKLLHDPNDEAERKEILEGLEKSKDN